MKSKLHNVHPGEILLIEFLQPLNVSQNKLAKSVGVSPRRINEICLNKRSLSIDTALRLGKYFNTEASFWLNLQNMYDMEEEMLSKQSIYNTIKPYQNSIDTSHNKRAS